MSTRVERESAHAPVPTGAVAEARALSQALFARLRSLNEGTREYQYVRNTIVEANLALVHHCVRGFPARSSQREDLVQVGTLGLIKAVNRFDPDRGVEFTSFALPTITGEMKRFFRDTSWALHVPRRLQEARIHLARASEALSKELGRAPTVAELSESMQLSEEEVAEAIAAVDNGYTATSLDGALDDRPEGRGSLAAFLGCLDPGLERAENLMALKPLIAELDDRSRTILSMRFWEDLTQTEIADRIGVSQMHVSRLLSRTLAQLREGMLSAV
jgi:RNA polymerase sigma-B factor